MHERRSEQKKPTAPPRKRSRYESEHVEKDGNGVRDRAREGRYAKYINGCCEKFGSLSKRIYAEIAGAHHMDGAATAAFRLAASLEMEAAAIAGENLAEEPVEIAHFTEKSSATAAVPDEGWLRACGFAARSGEIKDSPRGGEFTWRTWNPDAPHRSVAIESRRI